MLYDIHSFKQNILAYVALMIIFMLPLAARMSDQSKYLYFMEISNSPLRILTMLTYTLI